MTQTHIPAAPVAERTARRSRWPLYGAAAGVFGFAATMILDGRTSGSDVELGHQLFTDLDPVVYRLSMLTGYVAVVLLLVLAASWRRHVEPRLPRSKRRSLQAAVIGEAVAGALVSALRLWGESGAPGADALRKRTREALAVLQDLPSLL